MTVKSKDLKNILEALVKLKDDLKENHKCEDEIHEKLTEFSKKHVKAICIDLKALFEDEGADQNYIPKLLATIMINICNNISDTEYGVYGLASIGIEFSKCFSDLLITALDSRFEKCKK